MHSIESLLSTAHARAAAAAAGVDIDDALSPRGRAAHAFALRCLYSDLDAVPHAVDWQTVSALAHHALTRPTPSAQRPIVWIQPGPVMQILGAALSEPGDTDGVRHSRGAVLRGLPRSAQDVIEHYCPPCSGAVWRRSGSLLVECRHSMQTIFILYRGMYDTQIVGRASIASSVPIDAMARAVDRAAAAGARWIDH